VKQRSFYFTTRDLLMMATLAALGGAAGTYINAIGDFVQSILGFSGTTQWAAGLHILWLTLAVGLTRKQGAGTITGILKGVVELLTGNTHGLLVVLVDIVAGLLVDIGFLPFRKKDSLIAYCLAGGLASASNVLVFQMFASLPVDTLAYWAILLVAGVALLSGVIFGGILSRTLLNVMRRTGVVKDAQPVPMHRHVYPIFLVCAVLMSIGLTFYLRNVFHGPVKVSVRGAVDAPYVFSAEQDAMVLVTAEGTLNQVTSTYNGIPIRDLIAHAQPQPDSSLVLVKASDGYAFFISLEEVYTNDALLLSPQDKGQDTSYDIVGAINSKAWVRGVQELVVVAESTLDIRGALEHPAPYNPDEWQFDMDSAWVELYSSVRKLQGAPLGKVLKEMVPLMEAETIDVLSGTSVVSIPLSDALNSDDLRIYTVIEEDGISYTVGWMSGAVVMEKVKSIEIR
jgi:ABC-type thiamin/hydroxymethylpyrimidine transport system permease subunit